MLATRATYAVVRSIRSGFRSLRTRTGLARACAAALVITTGYGVATGSIFARTSPTLTPAQHERIERVVGQYLEPQTIRRIDPLRLENVAIVGQNVGGSLPAEQIAATPTERTHVVGPGDTLGEIAVRYGLSYSGSIMLANPSLDSADSIYPGQQLIVPASDATEEQLESERQRRAEARKKAQQKALATAKTPQAIKAAGFSFLRPINASYQSQGYSAGHPGLDLVANVGTPVRAIANGCITEMRTGWNSGYGTFVGFDMGNGFTALYAHLSDFADYSVGECVDAGSVIGYSGNTGRSSGPHLHFELRKNGAQVNPTSYLP
jgi:LysM repeat protein